MQIIMSEETKVITGKVRFSYANVFEPKSIMGSEPKYSISLIIPKSDTVTVNKIKRAIEAAKKEGVEKFGGKVPKKIKEPLRDGDVDREDDEAYQVSYFINANSMRRPEVIDSNLDPILDKDDFYSGCFGRASLNFFAYNHEGTKGVAVGLNNLQKLSDGEPLGAVASSASDDFGSDGDLMG